MANCPKCPNTKLVASKVTGDLSGLACTACEGLLLSLVNYRVWREARAFNVVPVPDKAIVPAPENTRAACLCPKCGGVMSKYHFSVDADSQLDFCYHCEEIWFDDGEWALLSELSLEDELTQIFTHPWQRSLLESKIAQTETARWQRTFGEDYQKITEMLSWLQAHPKKSQIVAYIFDAIRHN